jgi:hypothetical protein
MTMQFLISFFFSRDVSFFLTADDGICWLSVHPPALLEKSAYSLWENAKK